MRRDGGREVEAGSLGVLLAPASQHDSLTAHGVANDALGPLTATSSYLRPIWGSNACTMTAEPRELEGGRWVRRSVLVGVRTGLSVELVLLVPGRGETYCHWGRVGQSSLCSRVLLLPRGVPPAPAPAMLPSQDRKGQVLHRTVKFARCSNDVGNTTQGRGVPDRRVVPFSGAPQRCRRRGKRGGGGLSPRRTVRRIRCPLLAGSLGRHRATTVQK